MVNAHTSDRAVAEMLVEQEIEAEAEALLNLIGYTTDEQALGGMVEAIETDAEFQRLVASIVQDAARAAESVSIGTRPNLGWVRHLNLPSCSRCVALAGRVYRFSEGFLRHPGDDCTMTAVQAGDASQAHDPLELVQQGQVLGLSKADFRALAEGADFNRVVNVRKKAAGLLEAGHALTREGKPTPAGIYRRAGDDRELALRLLRAAGYIH